MYRLFLGALLAVHAPAAFAQPPAASSIRTPCRRTTAAGGRRASSACATRAGARRRGLGALRHRLARETDSPYKIDVHAVQDGQRALRLVRSKATEWNLKPDRIGMMGFSAGGETVALVCRKAEKGNDKADDPIDRESAIPSFQAHVYSGPQGLRGATVTKENSPPAFLLVGDDDNAKTWLIQHYLDVKKAGVSAELHVLAKAGHGFGFRPYKMAGGTLDTWPQLFVGFLAAEGMLK